MRRLSYTVTIEDELNGQAVKDILRKKFDTSRRLKIKLKKGGLVYLNGEKTEGWYPVYAGDVIEIELPEEESHFEAENIPLDVIHEDEDILVVNKQPFLCTHPTKGQPNHTVANAAQHYMLESGESYKIRFVNRLDRDTSGLIILGKNSHSQDNICRQMREHKTEKRYLAIVRGSFPSAGELMDESGSFYEGLYGREGCIELPLGRPDPDKVERGVVAGGHPSKTHYRVISEGALTLYGARVPLSLLELRLETGRTHQIRVHLSHIGHPILGDHLYGGLLGCEGAAYDYNKYVEGCPRECISCEKNLTPIKRQALHAYKISFDHPVSGKRLSFAAPPPPDMEKLIYECFGSLKELIK